MVRDHLGTKPGYDNSAILRFLFRRDDNMARPPLAIYGRLPGVVLIDERQCAHTICLGKNDRIQFRVYSWINDILVVCEAQAARSVRSSAHVLQEEKVSIGAPDFTSNAPLKQRTFTARLPTGSARYTNNQIDGRKRGKSQHR